MAKRLTGAPVAEQICGGLKKDIAALQEKGVQPKLGILRIGERQADLSYERSLMKRMESLQIAVERTVLLPQDLQGEHALTAAIEQMNAKPDLHGILIFRPLPANIDINAVRGSISPKKDVDAMTRTSMGGLFLAGSTDVFAPCTAEACMRLLMYYEIPLKGKHAVVVGAGETVGLPLAVMLMQQLATVTSCNICTPPEELLQLCSEADIVISAAGKAGLIGSRHLHDGQTVIDIGMSPGPDGKLAGDVDSAAAEALDCAYAPVFGGVSAVTTSVLAAHVVQAAKRN